MKRKKISLPRWLLRTFSEYLYPSLCISCRNEPPVGMSTGEHIMMLDPDGRMRGCFCARCRSDFITSQNKLCDKCGKPYSECECVPDAMQNFGVTRAYSCFAYEKGRRGCAASRLIYSLKSAENRDSVNFAAHLLASRIKKAFDRRGEDVSDIVISYTPRRRSAVRETGGDHMKLTAKLTARILDVDFAEMFRSTVHGEQKKRSAAERVASATSSYRLRRGIGIKDRHVVLIDDVITSGATLGVCAALAYGAGAEIVDVFALAKTAPSARRDNRSE